MTEPQPVFDVADLVDCTARRWSYSCSHDRLQLQLTRPDGRYQYLQFTFCERIELPALWHVEHPTLEHRDGWFTYRDSATTIICQALHIQEVEFP